MTMVNIGFDNWLERDKIEKEAEKLGIKYDDLLIIDSDRSLKIMQMVHVTLLRKERCFGQMF
jgi:hypothetical protein